MDEILTDKNFMLYAAKWYDNPQCTDVSEFYDDLKRINYLKRLFNRYRESGEIKERLILNHLVVLYNVFGPKATDMLFLKLHGYYGYLKPFILMMNLLPDVVVLENERIETKTILMDQKIVELLRKI